jgi:hypothetical protein
MGQKAKDEEVIPSPPAFSQRHPRSSCGREKVYHSRKIEAAGWDWWWECPACEAPDGKTIRFRTWILVGLLGVAVAVWLL